MGEIRLATFDCYGTLIDWEGGLGSFLYELARRHEHDPPPARELRERWEEIQFELIQGDYRSYAHVLRDSLRTWVGERGYRWNEQDGHALESAMQAWQPFPDTIPALTRAARTGVRLAILSNTDADLLDASLAAIGVEPDVRVVASEIGSYKPAPGHWEAFFERSGAAREGHVHVAASLFHDVEPAARLGLRCVWINRQGESSDLPRSGELADLSTLPDLLDRLVPPAAR